MTVDEGLVVIIAELLDGGLLVKIVELLDGGNVPFLCYFVWTSILISP